MNGAMQLLVMVVLLCYVVQEGLATPTPPMPPPMAKRPTAWAIADQVVTNKKERTLNEPFQGDIRLTSEQREQLSASNAKRSLILSSYRWPTKSSNGENIVEVPYVITSGVSSANKDMFMKGVQKFNGLTCIRLVPRTGQKDYIKVINGDGCYSYVGHVGGVQELSLSSGCQYLSTILHEVMHALGFFHEQARPDRDEFVTIKWENIVKDAKDQFEKYDTQHGISGEDLRQYPYDVKSIMSYKSRDFSKNGLPTIVNKEDPSEPFSGEDFSVGDLFKINSMYGCAAKYLNAKKYRVTVHTSNSWRSGTDARVFIIIYGNGKDSGEIELKKGSFEAGDVDTETFLLPNVSPITKIAIWHSNTGLGAGWKLKKVMIRDLDSNSDYKFNYKGWLKGSPSSNKKVINAN